MTTTVFYFIPAENREIELDFVRWNRHSLVVLYPEGTRKAGDEWRIGQKRLQKLLGLGLVRVEGYRPEWTQVERSEQ